MIFVSIARGRPLTLALSPQAGRGNQNHSVGEAAPSPKRVRQENWPQLLLPVCGEKVADRPDEGPNPPSSNVFPGGTIHVPHP